MEKEFIAALETVLRKAVEVPVTAAHWRTIEAVAAIVAAGKCVAEAKGVAP